MGKLLNERLFAIAETLYPEGYNIGNIVKKIEELNPSLDLNRLQVGDWFYLPTLEDLDELR